MTTFEGKLEHEVINVKKKEPSKIKSWLLFIFVIAITFFITRYAVSIIVVSGNSMEPSIKDEDIIITNNLLYTLDRNDIMVFEDENGFHVIKRIIALSGDTVEIINGTVILNGNPLTEAFTFGTSNDMEEMVVQEGTYFVLGDNRVPGESLDSRSDDVGLVTKEQIKGKLLVGAFPFQLFHN